MSDADATPPRAGTGPAREPRGGEARPGGEPRGGEARPGAGTRLGGEARPRAATRAPLVALLLVATVQFLAWMLVLPALQAPDESVHFAYTQRLVETHERPPLEGDGDPFSPELEAVGLDAGLRPLVGNLSARPYWTGLDERLWHAHDRTLGPDARDAKTGPNTASRNPPGSYLYAGVAYELASWGDFFDRLFAMRLANLPLYLLTIALTWRLAGQIFGDDTWARTIAAGAVAVQPQFAFVVAGVSPDPLLTAIWALFLTLAVRVVSRGLTPLTAGGLAALAAAAVLTHPRGAPLALLALLAAGLGLRHRFSTKVLVGGAAVAAAGVLLALVAGLGVLDSTSGAGFDVRQFVSYVWQFYLPKLPFMTQAIGPDYGAQQAFVDTFYGVFASLEVRWPETVYRLLAVATLAGLAALAVTLFRARAAIRARWDVALMLGAAPVVLIASLHFAAYRSLQIEAGDPIIVGRYLFVLLPLFGLAIAAIVRALPRRASLATGTTLLLTGALLGISGLGMTLVRFYV
ncbi:DUF2142 domain-containing protein [Solirubrobacter soli]|uniref:DUF2142 domain-containing protein n=1 Tax=Solirubrobacter soli TaxID=363832 RepID=UPI000400C71B|nr:glycosyltransferase family 39 protein [Solirubrobacter soli]